MSIADVTGGRAATVPPASDVAPDCQVDTLERGLLDDTIDERGEWRCVLRLTTEAIGEEITKRDRRDSVSPQRSRRPARDNDGGVKQALD